MILLCFESLELDSIIWILIFFLVCYNLVMLFLYLIRLVTHLNNYLLLPDLDDIFFVVPLIIYCNENWP